MPNLNPLETAERPAAAPVADQTHAAVVSIIDLDRTITMKGTFSPFLLFSALRRRRWRLTMIPIVLVLMAAYKLGLTTRKQLKQAMHRLMLGSKVSEEEIRVLVESYAERTMVRNLRGGMRELIEREKASGHLVILATAAHRFYAEPIALRLGISHVVATESVYEAGRLTSLIRGPNLYGQAKADAVAAKLTSLGLRPGCFRSRCYSDDFSDLPLFNASDDRIAVHPSTALHAHASREGWRLLRF